MNKTYTKKLNFVYKTSQKQKCEVICYIANVCLTKKKKKKEKKKISNTVKILKNGTPEVITIIVLQLEQLDFTVQYCVQKMQTE